MNNIATIFWSLTKIVLNEGKILCKISVINMSIFDIIKFMIKKLIKFGWHVGVQMSWVKHLNAKLEPVRNKWVWV